MCLSILVPIHTVLNTTALREGRYYRVKHHFIIMYVLLVLFFSHLLKDSGYGVLTEGSPELQRAPSASGVFIHSLHDRLGTILDQEEAEPQEEVTDPISSPAQDIS